MRVSVGRQITPHRARRYGSVCAQLDFTVQEALHPAIIHYQKNVIRGFASDLEADAAAFKRVHGRGAPVTCKILARTAGHGAASVTPAYHECGFHYGRHDD